MSLVVLDAQVGQAIIEAENGEIPVIVLEVEGHNRITDESEEQTLVLTLGNANVLGQTLIAESLFSAQTQEDESE